MLIKKFYTYNLFLIQKRDVSENMRKFLYTDMCILVFRIKKNNKKLFAK